MSTTIKHKQGTAGGYLVGRKHTTGGIKAVVKDTGQPIEVESDEVIITAPAVKDNKKRMFEGKMMTNRQILSKINQDGGGVSFAHGGSVPGKIKCSGKTYKLGGEVMTDHQIVKSCGCQHAKGGQPGVKKYPDLSQEKPDIIYEKGKGPGPSSSKMFVREIELSLKNVDNIPNKKLSTSREVYEVFAEIWDKASMNIQEEVYVLYLNHQNVVIGYNNISKGGINSTVMDPRLILGIAVKALATGIILAHNHPSGVLTPSESDKKLTKQIENAGKEHDITLLDHLILSPDGSYYSFLDEGILKDGGILYKDGGTLESDLVSEFQKIINERTDSYVIQTYRGHPEQLMHFVQEQCTDMTSRREVSEHKHARGDAYGHIVEMIGDKPLVLRAVAAIPQDQKTRILKSWKGKQVDPELRRALKTKSMGSGGTFRTLYIPDSIKNDHAARNSQHFDTYKRGGMFARGGAVKRKTVSVDQEKMKEFLRDLQIIRPFIPNFQVQYLNDLLRSEESDAALEIVIRLYEIIKKMPATYGTEKQETNEKIVYLHYFYGGSDWYIVKKDKGDPDDETPGQYQAFGYAILNGDTEMAEWGYISIEEIKQTHKIELDFHFDPKPFGQVKTKWEGNAEKPATGSYDENYADELIKTELGRLSVFEKGDITVNLTAAQWKEFRRNEQKNLHAENELLVAVASGWAVLISAARMLVALRDRLGHMTGAMADLRSRLREIIDLQPEGSNVPTTLPWEIEAISIVNDEDQFPAGTDYIFDGPKGNSTDLVKFASSAAARQWLEKLGFFDGDFRNEKNYQPKHMTTDDKIGHYAYRPLTNSFLTRGVFESALQGLQTLQPLQKEAKPAKSPPPAARSQQSSVSASQQTVINNQIRDLVKKNGTAREKYSAEELALLRLYEGAGAEKKTSTDARILDQFFTPMDICGKMWGLAFKHGFTFPGNVCEPAMGSGRFLSFIAGRGNYVRAYDVDETSYIICKVLYPQFDIRHGSFESEFFKGRRHVGMAGVDKFFDLVIGNPPYREYVSEFAPLGEKDATGASTFEMYFIARGIDILKPGGLLIYIIPNTFLSNDKKYNEFKEKLSKKCSLVDAYRLPNGVFGNTDVGTDIIVLRKNDG